MQLGGIHHVTAISANARNNHAFYSGVLGMRLVKKTVNQDDVSAYHLFYADAKGSAGTDLTFFEFEVPPERRGTQSVISTGLQVRSERALTYWQEQFQARNIRHHQIEEWDGRAGLAFEDPEGQRLRLIVNDQDLPGHPWGRSHVPPEHQILGLGALTISVRDIKPTELFLTRLYEMAKLREFTPPGSKNPVHVYAMGAGGPGRELHIVEEPDAPIARQGAGGVHHIALRCADDQEYAYWIDRYQRFGLRSSGPVDRFYFKSLYIREPNGILIEIATDGPGFATDEPEETMGEGLALPPFLESHRAEILAGLAPL